MKKFSIFMTLLFLLTSNHLVLADTIVETEVKSEVDHSEVGLYQELDMDEKLQLLTETAIKHDIPPEILKAIALTESKMLQFEEGKPLVTGDGGIGIMQVTNPTIKVKQDKLMYDTAYNIEIGARILKDKWNLQFSGRIPMINDGNPRILENWYFAVMAYNGLSVANDPNIDEDPYQETVYRELEKYSQIEVAEFPTIDIQYYENGHMLFPDKKLNWEEATTESTQMFVNGDSVYVMNSSDPNVYDYANLRNEPSTAAPVSSKLAYYTELEIVGGPYIGSSSRFNQFVLYEVKGSNFTGYIASSNIRKKSGDLVFKPWDEKTSSDSKEDWTIKLNKPADRETINARNVYIVDETGNGVFTTLSYHEDDRTIIVEPKTPFAANKQYSLMIKDLLSLTNEPLKENIIMPFSIK